MDFTKEDTRHAVLHESKHRGLSILMTRKHVIPFTRKNKDTDTTMTREEPEV